MKTSSHTTCNDAISCGAGTKNNFASPTLRRFYSNPARIFLIAVTSAMVVSISALAFDAKAALPAVSSPTQSGDVGIFPAVVSEFSFAAPGQGAVSTATVAAPIILAPSITVMPAVDLPGKTRVITISGQTYAGCPYMTPVIDPAASQLLGGVVIRLDPVPTLAPCSILSFTQYRFEIPYTPAAIGAPTVARQMSPPVRASIAATVPSVLAANKVAPDTLTSSGKPTGPIRAFQACLATTAPLTAWSAAGCGLLGLLKNDMTEQPDTDVKSAKVATILIAGRARKMRAAGLKDW